MNFYTPIILQIKVLSKQTVFHFSFSFSLGMTNINGLYTT